VLSKQEARRFVLAHQMLWPPRRLRGKEGILEFVRRVGAIQFDPVNVVGRNPDLVLQSRVGRYRPALLEELLYQDRQLVDGWDKVASILLTRDWPSFARHRTLMRQIHGRPSNPPMKVVPHVRAAIRERGPLSAIDFKDSDRIRSDWGMATTRARAALEILHGMGELVVDHRVGARRAFDLAERVLPAALLAAPDPIEQDSEYWDWRVLRRVGGLGLASPVASEFWLAMNRMKSKERQVILHRLVGRGDLLAVGVDGMKRRTFFMRRADLPTLQAVRRARAPRPQASFIAPLDNLMWHRDMLRQVFDFDYVWEVYKPERQRQYGYYVLPVLYGDRFVARFDPKFDRDSRELTVAGWWWEDGVEVNELMQAALAGCLREFAAYLGATHVRLGPQPRRDRRLRWAALAN
jgi:hypothetical protein